MTSVAQPPFTRPPVQPDGWVRGLTQNQTPGSVSMHQ